jgi:hypothetical protein
VVASSRGRERAERLAAEYAAGASLAEVGRVHGVTRERVRQVLKKHGFDMIELKRSSKEIRRQRKGEALETLVIERLRAGASPQTVAQEAGVPLDTVQLLGDVHPDVMAMARLERKQVTPIYSDAEILDCLQIANGELGGVMTGAEYGEVASSRRLADGRPWPGRQTAMGRFGSWRRALASAGLPANASSAMAGRRQFDQEHCIDAILEVERALGHVPSAREYDIYSRDHGGVPSLATVRHRHGQWRLAVQRAIAFRRSPG